MSWSRALGAVILALGISGCGFRPLYGGAGGTEVLEQLSQVRIETIEDRHGQILHNLLLDRINPEGRPDRPLYSLKIIANLNTTELGLRFTEIATRAQLTLQASFALTDNRTGKTLVNGVARSANSYNIPDSEYARVIAEKDATERAAREISDEIKSRLSLLFRN